MNSDEIQHNILYSCSAARKRDGEAIVHDHVLSYVITGEITFYHSGRTFTHGPGSIGLLRKNLLLKSMKIPAADGTPFQSLNIFFDQGSLRKYSGQTDVIAEGPVFLWMAGPQEAVLQVAFKDGLVIDFTIQVNFI